MARWKELTRLVQRAAVGVFKSEPALYRVAGADPPFEVVGIFRDEDRTPEVSLEVGAADVGPTFHVRVEVLPPGALEGETDTLELGPDHGSVLMRVRDSAPDGEGMVALMLVDVAE